jgi:hypothetical protein
MRLKTLTLFLAIQILSFLIWKTMSETAPVMAIEPASNTHAVSEEQRIAPDFAVRNFDESRSDLNALQKKDINAALTSLPADHSATVKNIILDYKSDAGRGLGGNNLIILRGTGMSEQELIGVLVHEVGHNVDYGYLSPKNLEKESEFKDGSYPLYITDASIDFYRICWENEKTRKKTVSNLDFVSGYAMSDPFEDFAETYVYYVLHNADFKALTSESPKLAAKYRFMQYRVFGGVEFNTGDGEVRANNRPWDITILAYNLSEFLS